MSAKIYCRTTDKGVQSFYLKVKGQTHFLFSQSFRLGVKAYFRRELSLNKALDPSRAGRNHAILNTMEKLPAYIRYVEREYDLQVLRKTLRKSAARSRCAV